MKRFENGRAVTVVLLLLLLSLAAPTVARADGCDAEISASLEHTEKGGDVTHLQFRVDIRTNEDCAKILYDLVIEEMLDNGQTKKVRKPAQIDLSNGSVSAVVRHQMPASHQMLSYEAQIVRCQTCDMFR